MKTELLAALRNSDGYVSGQELCETLGVSRTAVWKVMQKLKAEGYEIEAVSNKGYRLISSPDVLSAEELESIRKTSWAGQEIVYYDVTDSTNVQAKRIAEEGGMHGTLVVADRQESGKGRRGRGWDSPKNTGIFMTMLLRPTVKPDKASMLTLVAAMAVAKGIRLYTGLPAGVKWPNDIVINGKKVCGILTEMNTEIEYINYVVIGIGINVLNQSFPDEIKDVATSLLLEKGEPVKRAGLIEAIWEQFEIYYDKFCSKGNLSEIKEEYNSLLVNLDRQVRVLDPREPYEGTARGITDGGELMVEAEDGIRLVSSGEVSVRGIYGYV